MDRTSLAQHQVKASTGQGRTASHSTAASYDKRFGSLGTGGINGGGVNRGSGDGQQRFSSWMPGKLSVCTQQWREVRTILKSRLLVSWVLMITPELSNSEWADRIGTPAALVVRCRQGTSAGYHSAEPIDGRFRGYRRCRCMVSPRGALLQLLFLPRASRTKKYPPESQRAVVAIAIYRAAAEEQQSPVLLHAAFNRF